MGKEWEGIYLVFGPMFMPEGVCGPPRSAGVFGPSWGMPFKLPNTHAIAWGGQKL